MKRWRRFWLALAMGTLLFGGSLAALAHGTDISGDLHQAMSRMMAGMERVRMTGDPDQDFAAMMIRHHQGAIDMASLELKNGKDPEMRKMAQKTVAQQKKEIDRLNAWLRKHPPAARSAPEHQH